MKECIQLKQQTPMWHFQADTSGCVLRATEVKPKLDRFLLSKEKPETNWFVKGQTDALDYKLWFVAPLVKKPLTLKGKYPLFFGNMGEQQKKELIFYEEEIEMHLFSLNDGLIKKIKKHLFDFFATHSFGTRQDKGFGFFFPVEIDGEKGNFNQPFGAHYKFEFKWTDYNKKQKSTQKVFYPASEHKFVETFNGIHYFHKLIRSGINEGKCYYKSLMYFYAQSKGLQWDKPTIRHHFQLYTKVYQSICGQLKPFYEEWISKKKNGERRRKIYVSREGMDKEYQGSSGSDLLFRDALGLASVQKWMAYHDTIYIKADDEDFVRFKSPITYRPVIQEGRCCVYIHWDESCLKDMKGHTFTISHAPEYRAEITSQQEYQPSSTKMHLYKEFSLEDYFEFIETHYRSLRKQYSRDKNTRMNSGGDNFYIRQIFSLNQENFRMT